MEKSEEKKKSLADVNNDLMSLKAEIERLNRELAAAQQERSQSAAYGIELLNKNEKLQREHEALVQSYQQSKRDLKELREAWNKAVNEQRISATTSFEKEVQLLNDSDALHASFSHAIQELEKELKQTKSQLENAIVDKDRYLIERDDLSKRLSSSEQERKNLRNELKDLKSRETKLFNENSELEEENVSLQKQVSNLRSTQVEFESSKHEIQRLQDETSALNSQLEEMVSLRRLVERQMQEALEALQSERDQKHALRKELDKRNSADPALINWTSLAALKGTPHLANLALRNYNNPRDRLEADDGSPTNGLSDHDGGIGFSDTEQSYDIIHELEMPSIEGSLFDEVHLNEIKKLQQNLEEKENQRSNLNTKLIEIQHKLESKIRQAEDIEKKLGAICALVEDTYNETENLKLSSTPKKQQQQQQNGANNNKVQQVQSGNIDDNNKSLSNNNDKSLHQEQVTSTTNEDDKQPKTTSTSSNNNNQTKSNILDDFDNIYSHLQNLFADFKSYQETVTNTNKQVEKNVVTQSPAEMHSIDHHKNQAINEGDKKVETTAGTTTTTSETINSDDVQSLKTMLDKKNDQLKQLRIVLKSNKESAEVALANLKSKYEMEKVVVAETMSKLRHEHKRLSEDAATFASLRSHFSARIEEYNTEIEKLQSKLSASEQEKNTLNSILRMAIEQKIMLTQKLEALEMDREDLQSGMHKGGANGQQPRSGVIRGRGSSNRNTRPIRSSRLSGGDRR